MTARTAYLLRRDMGEHDDQNVDIYYLPWLYPAPGLADAVAKALR
jgi:hypothetical protein